MLVSAVALVGGMPGWCQDCAQIAGSYSGTESSDFSLSLLVTEVGKTVTSDVSDVQVAQFGTNFSCKATISDQDYTWTGTLQGNKIVSITGPIGFSLASDYGSVQPGNASGNGRAGRGVLLIQLKGSCRGTVEGLSGDLHVRTTATLYGPAVPVPDTTPPTLHITAPVANRRLTAPELTARGTATDDANDDDTGVAQVFCRLNRGAWVEARGSNAWTAALTPAAVTNTLEAYAVDGWGNCSATDSVSFFQVITSPLTVQTRGSGKVVRGFSGNRLIIGDTYTITAVPASPAWMFAGWSGDAASGSPALRFTMRSNMTLIANFAANAFPARMGNYRGLFFEQVPRADSSGAFALSLRNRGAFSGKLTRAEAAYSFSGQFDAYGQATTVIARRYGGPITARWQIDLATVTDTLDATLTTESWTVTGQADRCTYDALTNPAPACGRYTLLIPGSEDPTAQPGGEGYGAVTVRASGIVQFTGSLADGSRAVLSQSAALSKQGRWPFFLPLYSGGGCLFGWLTFTNDGAVALGGRLNWLRSPQPRALYYTNGFALQPQAVGSAYTFTNGVPILNFSVGQLWFSGGNLPAAFTNQIRLGPRDQVTSTNKTLRLTWTTSSGLFSGSVGDPYAEGTRLSFKGAVLQQQDFAGGYFLGTNQTGRVVIAP